MPKRLTPTVADRIGSAGGLAQARAIAVRHLDHELTPDARARFVTLAPGQEATYQIKEAEALAFQSDAAPDTANYPVLAGAVGTDGADLAAVASLVLTKATDWRQAAGAIDGARRAGKAAIVAAKTAKQVATALADARAALDAIKPV